MANHYEKLVSLSVYEMTKYIKTLDSGALNDTMELAVESGYSTIVWLCQKHGHGASDFNRVLEHAAKNGDDYIVTECIAHGAINLDRAMVIAAASGHIGIVNTLRKNGATSLDRAMMAAVVSGRANIVRACKKWGATTNVNRAITLAAKNGYTRIVRSFITWGATDADVSDALTILIPKDDDFTVEYDDNWYVDDLNVAMKNAAGDGQIKVVQLCLRLGAFLYRDAIESAEANGHKDISSLVKEWRRRHDQNRLKILK